MKKLTFILFLSLYAWQGSLAQKQPPTLTLTTHPENGNYGYQDSKGKMIVPFGKYSMCFTEKFVNYAIVVNSSGKIVAIDRKFNEIYEVFVYDNGPDYASEGIFRIVKAGLIGYADEKSGKILIEPQYPCAYPFQGGKAKVSTDCKIKKEGEHTSWEAGKWHMIEKPKR